MSWYTNYPKSTPKKVAGGIRANIPAKNSRQSWWARRWIEVLENFDLGGRLQRGRSYARNGQVLEIHIESGLVKAKVQGSDSTPYGVRIAIVPFTQSQCQQLSQTLAKQMRFAAQLLAGQMPQDIEQSFEEAGLSLFPESEEDLVTSCSCPDWSNPCKHIAAVYYLIGHEFDRDPFLLFKLRGLDRDQLLANLKTSSSSAGSPENNHHTEDLPREPLACEADAFWKGGELPAGSLVSAPLPVMTAALVKRLGNLPFWRSETSLLDELKPVYINASERARQLGEGPFMECGDLSPRRVGD